MTPAPSASAPQDEVKGRSVREAKGSLSSTSEVCSVEHQSRVIQPCTARAALRESQYTAVYVRSSWVLKEGHLINFV